MRFLDQRKVGIPKNGWWLLGVLLIPVEDKHKKLLEATLRVFIIRNLKIPNNHHVSFVAL
jgi:hypothetical protein